MTSAMPVDPSVTYNGHGTMLKTEDQGDTWTVAWSSTTKYRCHGALFLSTDTGFAGTQGGNIMERRSALRGPLRISTL